jgi:hypothetical protein
MLRILLASLLLLASVAEARPHYFGPTSPVVQLGVLNCANAGTSVSGAVGGQHWTCSGSPYRVTGNLTVASGTVLTVDPGVKVEFQGRYDLEILGGLYSVGTSLNRITWTTTAADIALGASWVGWRGIRWMGSNIYPPEHDHGTGLFRMEYNDVGYQDALDETQADPWMLMGVIHLEAVWVGDTVLNYNRFHHGRAFAFVVARSSNDPASPGTSITWTGNTAEDSAGGFYTAHLYTTVHFAGGGASNNTSGTGAGSVATAVDNVVYLDGFLITNCSGTQLENYGGAGTITYTPP